MIQRFVKKWPVALFWLLLISIYGYWQLTPEVSVVNATGQPIKHIEIEYSSGDKVYRNIMPGDSKSFRYQPATAKGAYKLRVILSDERILKQEARLIEAWNLGHKIIFEILPDGSIRIDLSYSIW